MVDRFAYAPIDGRPPIRWPEGRRLAVWVVPNVEHYEFLPSTTGVRNPWPRSTPPDALNYPRREYALPLHAWVAGAAHRAPSLRRALATHTADRFWQAGPAAIAAQWRSVASHNGPPAR